ncbi:hypothetical protein SNE40_000536 [Patella caerulea]|uniref:Chitin-binding type-2 domain-containing protein n=1 Tax=Patella caerulea TaxID=87958 RepID=A0AAN8KAN2_PATCE
MELLVVVLALVAIQLQESSTSTCSYSCRESYKTTRKCGLWGWSRCSSTAYRASTCYRTCTHGGYSSWSTTYGPCSKTCGGGIQSVTKKRQCTNPRPSGGGRPCSGPSYTYTTQSCNTQSCPVHGGFSSYRLTNTGACSKTCGGGVKQLTYTRSCSNPTPRYGGRSCVGPTTKTESNACNTQQCPINGGWTDYRLISTGECTVSCGGGTKTLSYSRTCTNPRPQYGGDDCDGASTKETQEDCNTHNCPINGGWAVFTLDTTGDCSVSCGGGTKILSYVRTCTNPRPQYGGDECDGVNTKDTSQECNTNNCPIHGGWTEYTLSDTSDCSTTCGGGEKILTFTRSCTDPSPMYGGNGCVGDTERTDTTTCNENPCPVNGGWTDFTEWEEINECDSLCGGGIKEEQRDRTCTNPAPAYGGDDCDGESSQVRNVTCNTELCGDKCPSGRNTYIAHGGNKNRYYQCDNDVARLRDCAVGTMWSQDHTNCINIPVSTECDVSDDHIADPDNCHNYRICDGGLLKTVSCAPGTAFNPAMKRCALIENIPSCN